MLCSVTASLHSLSVLGLPEPDTTQSPTLISSHGETVGSVASGGSFVDLLFETNPLDGTCDTRIRFSARPLETTFDAVGGGLFPDVAFCHYSRLTDVIVDYLLYWSSRLLPDFNKLLSVSTVPDCQKHLLQLHMLCKPCVETSVLLWNLALFYAAIWINLLTFHTFIEVILLLLVFHHPPTLSL